MKNPSNIPTKTWVNWRAHTDGVETTCGHEFNLYSDSIVNGTTKVFGPYQLVNLLAGERRETNLARPVLNLRIFYAINPNAHRSHADHGRRHQDEIAALVSLILGIRVQAGGEVRHFDFRNDADRLGTPQFQAEIETPVLLQGPWTPVIAHARREVSLSELGLLETFSQLDASKATMIVRSARLYQEALWISEREPWLSWLLLVSAIETAAQEHKHGSNVNPVDLLKELSPDLAQVAANYGENCLQDIARLQVQRMGATKKFLAFVKAFLPSAPAHRPDDFRLTWSADALSKPLKQIYSMRSQYLHGGVPFPWQLRGVPLSCNGVPMERFPDLAQEASRAAGEPRTADPKLPMQLHVFEHITRGALLRWWCSMAKMCQATGDAPT